MRISELLSSILLIMFIVSLFCILVSGIEFLLSRCTIIRLKEVCMTHSDRCLRLGIVLFLKSSL
jgi:hypothetical protein